MVEKARADANGGPLKLLQRFAGGGSNRSVKLAASNAFFIRIANAGIAYLSQIIMARWMGAFEYGIYVYVWTWVLLIGTIADLGFSITAQRVIPTYLQANQLDRVRGFIHSCRWIPGLSVTVLASLSIMLIWLLSERMDAYLVFPLLLACIALPPYGMTAAQDGAARAFGWINLALLPPFILRPVLLLLFMLGLFGLGMPLDATTAMWAAVVATWLTAVGQIVVFDRRLRQRVENGPRQYLRREWISSSLPVLCVNFFQFMLSYVGVLLLEVFRSPADIAIFYAATKITAIVSMVYFAVSASAAYRFAALDAAGDREGLKAFYAGSTRWTLLPTVLVSLGILVAGKPLLWLFGEEFTAGYSLVIAMIIGLVVRAAIGPGEQMLNMLGQQRMCAAIFGAAFVFNLLLCFALIPSFGAMGAAIAATASIVLETLLIHLVIKRKFGIKAIISLR